jgi:hypothetical protein
MSFKLKDLQDVAEAKSKEYGKPMDCLPAVLYAINDALKDVDTVNYIDPAVLKAVSPLPMGFGAYDGPCGAFTAGSVAIGMKYGTADQKNRKVIQSVMMRSREWANWFRYLKFGSTNCFEMRGKPPTFSHCLDFMGQSSRKLVDILTEDNSNVIR